MESLGGKQVGAVSLEDIEQHMRNGYDIYYEIGNRAIYIEITYIASQFVILLWCHWKEQYVEGYQSLRSLSQEQPYDLKKFRYTGKTTRYDEE